MKRRGFTFIELLVLIAVMAILAALLAPVLERSRESARRACCLGNLMRLGSAAALYRIDTGDYPYLDNMSLSHPWWKRELGSWDDLYPRYVADPMLWWCPSDKSEVPPRPDTFGLDQDGKERHYHCGDEVSYYCREAPLEVRTAKCGLSMVDDLSYVYTGGVSVQHFEEKEPGELRFAADNDCEGDAREIPPDRCCWRFAGRISYSEQSPMGAAEHYYTGGMFLGQYANQLRYMLWAERVVPEWVRYEYIGGLEQGDNHSTDGVNVLFLDGHGAFDRRQLPWPIGWMEGWVPEAFKEAWEEPWQLERDWDWVKENGVGYWGGDPKDWPR